MPSARADHGIKQIRAMAAAKATKPLNRPNIQTPFVAALATPEPSSHLMDGDRPRPGVKTPDVVDWTTRERGNKTTLNTTLHSMIQVRERKASMLCEI